MEVAQRQQQPPHFRTQRCQTAHAGRARSAAAVGSSTSSSSSYFEGVTPPRFAVVPQPPAQPRQRPSTSGPRRSVTVGQSSSNNSNCPLSQSTNDIDKYKDQMKVQFDIVTASNTSDSAAYRPYSGRFFPKELRGKITTLKCISKLGEADNYPRNVIHPPWSNRQSQFYTCQFDKWIPYGGMGYRSLREIQAEMHRLVYISNVHRAQSAAHKRQYSKSVDHKQQHSRPGTSRLRITSSNGSRPSTASSKSSDPFRQSHHYLEDSAEIPRKDSADNVPRTDRGKVRHSSHENSLQNGGERVKSEETEIKSGTHQHLLSSRPKSGVRSKTSCSTGTTDPNIPDSHNLDLNKVYDKHSLPPNGGILKNKSSTYSNCAPKPPITSRRLQIHRGYSSDNLKQQQQAKQLIPKPPTASSRPSSAASRSRRLQLAGQHHHDAPYLGHRPSYETQLQGIDESIAEYEHLRHKLVTRLSIDDDGPPPRPVVVAASRSVSFSLSDGLSQQQQESEQSDTSSDLLILSAPDTKEVGGKSLPSTPCIVLEKSVDEDLDPVGSSTEVPLDQVNFQPGFLCVP